MMSEISIAMGDLGRGHRPTRIRLQRANVRSSFRLEKHQGSAPRRNPRHHVRSRGPLSETLAVRTQHIGSDRQRYLASRTSASARCLAHRNPPNWDDQNFAGMSPPGRGGPDRHWGRRTWAAFGCLTRRRGTQLDCQCRTAGAVVWEAIPFCSLRVLDWLAAGLGWRPSRHSRLVTAWIPDSH